MMSKCNGARVPARAAAYRFGYVAVLQTVTIGWMLVECGGSLFAAARARSLPMAASLERIASSSFSLPLWFCCRQCRKTPQHSACAGSTNCRKPALPL